MVHIIVILSGMTMHDYDKTFRFRHLVTTVIKILVLCIHVNEGT